MNKTMIIQQIRILLEQAKQLSNKNYEAVLNEIGGDIEMELDRINDIEDDFVESEEEDDF